MNILYLHGLDGSLSQPKRSILEQYGAVYAPQLDYRNEPNCMRLIYEQFKDHNIDRLIGSSMGGYMGYYLSNALDCKALLFNPALAARPVKQERMDFDSPTAQTKTLVLGAEDTVVPPKKTLQYLSKQALYCDYQISIQQGLAHRIPITTFETAVQRFFTDLWSLPNMYSLFLDDLRTPEMIYPASAAETFVVVRSCQGLLDYFLLLICYSGLGKYEVRNTKYK